MTLEYEPIREGERYVRRWSWHCWCVHPFKQVWAFVIGPDAVAREEWVDEQAND